MTADGRVESLRRRCAGLERERDLLRAQLAAAAPTETPHIRECPFCGAGALHLQVERRLHESFRVSCGACHTQGPMALPLPSTKEAAILLWNTRKPLAIRPEEVKYLPPDPNLAE